jgi:hypothetical protein
MGTLDLSKRHEGRYDALQDRVGIEFLEGAMPRILSHQLSVSRRHWRPHQKIPPPFPLMISCDAKGLKS